MTNRAMEAKAGRQRRKIEPVQSERRREAGRVGGRGGKREKRRRGKNCKSAEIKDRILVLCNL